MENNSGGISLIGILTIVLIALKLTGFINWAWVWILAPIWGGTILLIFVVVVCIKVLEFYELI